MGQEVASIHKQLVQRLRPTNYIINTLFHPRLCLISMSYQYVKPSPELTEPCGAIKYFIRPHGVIKVVKCLSLGSNGTLWYPFQASVVYLQVWGGTPMACLKGASVKCVCLEVALFTSRSSTTRLESPVFFPTTCIQLHHVVLL